MNTLRGIFPEPKPVYKRNFIHENKKQIKHLQGTHAKVEVTKPVLRTNHRYQDIPAKVTQYMKSSNSLSQANNATGRTRSLQQSNKKPQKTVCETTSIENAPVESPPEPETVIADILDTKYRNTGVQTDSENSKEGKTKYPTKTLSMNGGGDHISKTTENLSSLSINDKNELSKKSSSSTNLKRLTAKNSTDRPDSFQGYQRGVVPKYLRDRQKEQEPVVPVDKDCPPGHITIPDAERKETLRALRQSYADLIGELNLLPVKTDTLRTRNRKIELEKQLDKIEEGIKVFSRPKVYVKINS